MLAYAALILGASALKMESKSAAKVQATYLPSWDKMEAWLEKEVDRDGSVEWHEVEDKLNEWAEDRDEEVEGHEMDYMEAAFHYFDINGDEHVTHDELECAMDRQGCDAFDKKVQAVYEIDIDEEDCNEIENYLEEKYGHPEGGYSWK